MMNGGVSKASMDMSPQAKPKKAPRSPRCQGRQEEGGSHLPKPRKSPDLHGNLNILKSAWCHSLLGDLGILAILALILTGTFSGDVQFFKLNRRLEACV